MAPGMSILYESEEAIVVGALKKMKSSLKADLISSSPAVNEGENFMSFAVKIDVSVHDEETGERFERCMLLKRLPQSMERRQLFQCVPAFTNEAAFYTNVLPFLQRQTSEKNVLPFPPCLGASSDHILLRHLGQDGFGMCSRRNGLDLQHCQLVLRELAIFHAVSLKAKYSYPEEFARVRSTLKEWFVSKENPIINTSVDNAIQTSLNVLTDVDSPTARKLKEICGRGLEVLSLQISPSEPLSVITHGDLWSNNLLFRYLPWDSQSPTNVCFLDLQVARYGSPALDILYFIFTSGAGILQQHFHHLVAEYHSALTGYLERYAPEVPTVTVDDIMMEIRRSSIYGLVISLMVLPVVTAENNNFTLDGITEDMLQDPEFQKEFQKNLLGAEYKKRVNEIYSFCDIEELV